MNEMSLITSALSMQQAVYGSELGVAMLKNAQQADQAVAQMLMDLVKSGQVLNNSSGGSIDLYV